MFFIFQSRNSESSLLTCYIATRRWAKSQIISIKHSNQSISTFCCLIFFLSHERIEKRKTTFTMAMNENSQHHINEVLNQLGWPSDSILPICNAENRELLDRINALTDKKTEKKLHFEYLAERVEWLREHYKQSEHEFHQNHQLLQAHRQQLETEDHLLKLAQNNLNGTKKEIKNVEKQFEELTKEDSIIDGKTLQF